MFQLKANPTFKADVKFQLPDASEAKIEFEFKHMGRKALGAFFENLGSEKTEKTDAQLLREIAVGWGLTEEFSDENIEEFLDNYPMSAIPIVNTWRNALTEGRTKNSS